MRASAPVDADAFKQSLRSVAASVAVVTTRAGSLRAGFTTMSVCSVSAEPPAMLACINREASAEAIVARSGRFAINFLTEAQHAIARLFSQSRLDAGRRFAEGTWITLVTGAPVLRGAAASFDCEVQQRLPAGTHILYIGRVVAVDRLPADTLLYRNGLFRRLEQVE
jgi:flavin reductase